MIFIPTLCFPFLGCSEKMTETGNEIVYSEPQEIESIEKIFTIPEGPFDLAQHSDSRIFISGEASGKLYSWDQNELREETGDYNDIQAILFLQIVFMFSLLSFLISNISAKFARGR